MLKCWKKSLAFAVVLGWAGGAALAQAPVPTVAAGSGSSSAAQGSGSPAPAVAGGCCAAAPASSCSGSIIFESCCEESRPWGFEAGGELHVLRPVITNNAGLITFETPVLATNTSVQNFNYDFHLSPSVWLGYTTECGLGFRATWFRFYESANPLGVTIQPNTGTGATSPSNFLSGDVTGGGGPATYTATSNLFIENWDFDITQSFKVCHLNITAGAGIRWSHIDQGYGATRTRSGGPEFAFESLYTENDANSFRGVGPTLLLEAHRPIGCGAFSLYANSRIGLLFGDRQESSTQFHSFTSGVASDLDTTTTSSDSDQLIGFFEIEAGAEWAKQCGRFQPFVRVGFEGRGYFGTGNAQSGAVFGTGTEIGSTPGIPSLGHTSDIGLYGFTFSAGVKF